MGAGPSGAEKPASAALSALLEATRRALGRAALLEAAVVSTSGLLGITAAASAADWLGLPAGALALLEVVLLAALISWVGLRYGGFLRRAIRSDEAVAAWLDRASHLDLPSEAPPDRLLSAVELLRDRGRFGESEALADAAVDRAASRAEHHRPRELVRREAWTALRIRLVLAALSGLVVILLAILAPDHLTRALGATSSLGTLEEALKRAPPEPRLGDMRLTYRYPAYSERAPRTMQSPSGHVRALAGTEVTIETQARDQVREASLLMSHGDDAAAEPSRMAIAVDGRRLTATFVVTRSGRYRFSLRTTDGRLLEERRGHELELELDEPPEVSLLEPRESPLEVNERDRLTLVFSAADDFALGDAQVSWRVLGSAREGRVRLTSAPSGLPRYSGSAQLDLAQLDLRPGDRLAYSVEVRDNDTVNGPKAGASETKELRVYSKKAHHGQVLALQEQSLDELVHILGDNLDALFEKNAELDRYRELIVTAGRIVERAGQADDLLRRTILAIRKDPLGRSQVAEAFEQTRVELSRDTRGKRSSLVAAERALSGRAAVDPSRLQALGRSQGRMVGGLEKNVVYLADLLNDQRMIDAEALTKELREQQQALKQALEDYKNAPTQERRQVLAQAIQEIRRRIFEIVSELSKIRGAIPQDFVNQDALASDDGAEALDRVERLLEEGDLDGAMQALDQMLGQTEKMLAELQSGRQELQSREYSEITERAEQLWKELGDIEQDERDLANRTESVAKEMLERQRSRLGDPGSFVEKQLKRLAQVGRQLAEVRPESHMPDAELFELTERRVEDGAKALEMRDFGAAKEVLERAIAQMTQLEQDARRRADQSRKYGDFFGMGKSADRAERTLGKARPVVEEVLEDIEALTPPPESLLSEAERRELGRKRERQREIRQRTEKLGEGLKELGMQLPIVGSEVESTVKDIAGAMGEAEGGLGRGDAPGALGHERAALEKLGQLKEELEKMGQQGRGGSGGGVPLPFGQPSGGSAGEGMEGNDPRSMEKVEIPKPEQYQAPAEFREDILEAAKQGTVESYREAVRRYYEELVK